MIAEAAAPEVQATIRGRLGVVTLNRAKALNALNLEMVELLDALLADWAGNKSVDAVLIRSANERAFCAGGDVRSIGIPPDPAERMARGRAFFGTEYKVNYRISTFPKPFIALINGIAMGGGLGVSVHGSHRIVSEDLRMAMPETMLGLFPDVGAAWFLNRCPGAIGRYLALVGPQIGAADALAAGLATHHVPYASFDELTSALASEHRLDGAVIDSAINAHAAVPALGALVDHRDEIDQLFAGEDLDAVIERIDVAARRSDWAAETRSALLRASPTSLRATWRRMTEADGKSVGAILADDYRMAVRTVGGHDFAEGVRAILVDKDQSPRWAPASLSQVNETDIDFLLAPMADVPVFERPSQSPSARDFVKG